MNDRDNTNGFFQFLEDLWEKGNLLALFVGGMIAVTAWYQGNPKFAIVVLVVAIIIISFFACVYFGFIKHPENKNLRWLAILSFFCIIYAVYTGFQLYQYQANLPAKDFRILVADFETSDAQNYQVTQTIFANLVQQMEKYEDVKIEKLGKAIDNTKTAKEIGKQKKAAIVMWSKNLINKDIVPINVDFEILQKQDDFPELGESVRSKIQVARRAELESFTLQTNLSDELTYLSLFTLGVHRYLNEDWSQAIDCFETALEHVEDEQNKSIASLEKNIIYLQLGNSFESNKSYDKALESYNKAIEIQPNYADALNNRGAVLNNLGQHKKAIADFDRVIKIQPEYAYAWYNRGTALSNLGQHKKAIAAYDKAIEIQPDNAYAWYNRGTALAHLNKHQQAIADFDRAVKIEPDYVNALNNRGAALAHLNKHQQAISDFDQIIKIQPNYAYAWYNKAASYALQNKADLALQNLEQAFKFPNTNLKEYIKTDTGFDSIRSNRRFQNLVTSKDSKTK